MQALGVREPAVLAKLRAETALLPQGEWQVSPEEGQLLNLLIGIARARRIIELGTFVGYGTAWMALALPPDGRIITCDIDEQFPRLGRPYWQEAGLTGRIELRLMPGLDLLGSLLNDGRKDSFDLIFIDADKPAYPDYYELAYELAAPGGLILIDNVFWDGAVVDGGDTSKSTRAIRQLNERLHSDPRVDISMVPIGDGLTIARKGS